MDKYFITKMDDHGEEVEREVPKDVWIRYERSAGFYPKCHSSDPKYMTECATAGFSTSSKYMKISGRIEFDKEKE